MVFTRYAHSDSNRQRFNGTLDMHLICMQFRSTNHSICMHRRWHAIICRMPRTKSRFSWVCVQCLGIALSAHRSIYWINTMLTCIRTMFGAWCSVRTASALINEDFKECERSLTSCCMCVCTKCACLHVVCFLTIIALLRDSSNLALKSRA